MKMNSLLQFKKKKISHALIVRSYKFKRVRSGQSLNENTLSSGEDYMK